MFLASQVITWTNAHPELKLTQPQNSKNRLNNVGIRGMLCETIASRTTAQLLRRMFAHNLNGVWWILAQPAGNCYCTAEQRRREGGGREGAVAVAVRPIGVGRGQRRWMSTGSFINWCSLVDVSARSPWIGFGTDLSIWTNSRNSLKGHRS